MAPDDPGTGPDGKRLGRLLRWYPRAWRERRLDLAPRVRAAERALIAVALPAILIMVGVDVVWYSATTSSVFWMSWGLVWFLAQGQRAIGEIRRGRTG
jgi:hypothetical protein